jgi:predicted 2-oxoglutarate/Fe(II)-dependent dioxygenase YbiX
MLFIKTIESFLSKEECDDILNKFLNVDLEVAKVGGVASLDSPIKVRDSKVVVTQLPHYKKKLETVLRNEIKIKGFELDEIENFQFTKYELNGHFDWHVDSGDYGHYAKRFCSIVIQLNNEYDGGELLYKDHNDNVVEFKKGVGNLFVFNSSTLHKVNPIIGGERYSLVAWISLKETSNFKKTLL